VAAAEADGHCCRLEGEPARIAAHNLFLLVLAPVRPDAPGWHGLNVARLVDGLRKKKDRQSRRLLKFTVQHLPVQPPPSAEHSLLVMQAA